MAILKIDTDTASLSWDSIVALEGTEYLWEMDWSDREARWYLNIKSQDGTALAAAVPIVVAPFQPPIAYTGLLRRYQAYGNVPPGRLLAVDMTGKDQDIQTPDELGRRVPLLYITSDDPLITG